MSTSYTKIKAQIADLTRKAETARKAELGRALATIRELVRQYDLTQEDVLGLFKGRRGANERKGRVGKPSGVPKYRDPKSGKTWTGRGKPPNWIKGARNRDAFLIDQAAASPSGEAVERDGRAGVKRAAPKKRAVQKKKATAPKQAAA